MTDVAGQFSLHYFFSFFHSRLRPLLQGNILVGKGGPRVERGVGNAMAVQIIIPIVSTPVLLDMIGTTDGLLHVSWVPHKPTLLLGASVIPTPGTFATSPIPTSTPPSLPQPSAATDVVPHGVAFPVLESHEAQSHAKSIVRFINELASFQVCHGVTALANVAAGIWEIPLLQCQYFGNQFAVLKVHAGGSAFNGVQL